MNNISIRSISKILEHAEDPEDIDIYSEEILKVLPIVKVMIGFDQKNHTHQYDLWNHSLHTVVNLPRELNDEVIYLAALLHDIGKPTSITIKPGDEDYHYYGHQEMSYEILRDNIMIEQMRGERYSDRDIAKLLYYVRYHDYRISLKRKHLRKHLRFLTVYEFKCLMHLEIADAKAHIIEPVIQDRIDICTQWTTNYANQVYKEILEENDKVSKLKRQLISNSLSSNDIFVGII